MERSYRDSRKKSFTQKIPSFLLPTAKFILTACFMLFIWRVIYLIYYFDRVTAIKDFYKVFYLGLKIDLIILSYLSIIPLVIYFIIPHPYIKWFYRLLRIYFTFWLSIILFMEVATIPFINFYDTRPNRLFIEYLVYPKEVIGLLVKGYLLDLILGIVFTLFAFYLFYRYWAKHVQIRPSKAWNKTIFFPIVGFLVFWGARGNLTEPRPDNPSLAMFSNDHMVNSLSLNSLYSVFYAIYQLKNEKNASKMYGSMKIKDAFKRVKKASGIPQSLFVDQALSTQHRLYDTLRREKKLNVVILLQESLGAEYVGSLGGLPLTPHIDSLSKQGVLFNNLFCTGTRSVRGIEAVVSGFLPTPSRSVVKLGKSQEGFFTLAKALKLRGYKTSFIYGGSANFDNMAGFFSGNGFDSIIDEKDYKKYAFKGNWGVSDEDLMLKAHNTFLSYGDKPFFSLVFSSSNHEPFEYPKGRIKPYEQKPNTVNNAIKYADYAIGKFFKMAKKSPYYKNTIFLIIADHNTRTYGKELIPIKKFRIPALLIGPGISPEICSKQVSQIDMPVMLMSLLNLNMVVPTLGHNPLDSLNYGKLQRSFMQFYENFAYRVNDTVTVFQPKKKAVQFVYKSGDLKPLLHENKKLILDGLAYQVVTGYLYNNRLYNLQDE